MHALTTAWNLFDKLFFLKFLTSLLFSVFFYSIRDLCIFSFSFSVPLPFWPSLWFCSVDVWGWHSQWLLKSLWSSLMPQLRRHRHHCTGLWCYYPSAIHTNIVILVNVICSNKCTDTYTCIVMWSMIMALCHYTFKTLLTTLQHSHLHCVLMRQCNACVALRNASIVILVNTINVVHCYYTCIVMWTMIIVSLHIQNVADNIVLRSASHSLYCALIHHCNARVEHVLNFAMQAL